MERKKLNLNFEALALVLLFLFAISFRNLAGYIVCALFLVFLLKVARKSLLLDGRFFILLLFSCFYYLSYSYFEGFGIKQMIWYLLAPWCCYLCGKWFVLYASRRNQLPKLVLTIAGGFFIHGMLNVIALFRTYGIQGVMNSPYRITMDYWRGEVISVTASSLYYVPLMTLSLGYLFGGSNKKWKIVAAVVVALGAITNAIYANRTAFVILAILAAVGFLSALSRRNNGIIWLCAIFLVLAAVVAWVLDLGGIQSWVMSLRVMERFAANDQSRFDLWEDFIFSDWWRYPLGGEQVGERSVHNLWLDTLRTAGIVPFVTLVLFTLLSLVDTWRYCSRGERSRWCYGYMICGILLSSAVEPVMSANPYYVMLWMMSVGGINAAMICPEEEAK